MLDKSVQWRIDSGSMRFEEPGYRTTVEGILATGLATEVVGLLSAGKEADVYLTRYHGGPLAVKVYRLYRTSHRGGRPVKLDRMSWLAAYEFELLRMAWKGGARVPTPAKRVENMLAMRYLGDEDRAAPRLQDVRLDDPEPALAAIVDGVEQMAVAGVVHGDLSAFNILLYRGEPWFIDLPDGFRVDRLGAAPWRRLQQASDLLTRGLTAVNVYFRKYGLSIEVDGTVARIVERLDRRGVLK